MTVPRFSIGAGSVLAFVTFQNVGPTPCDMFGYPEVAGLDDNGVEVLRATHIALRTRLETTVTLFPLQFAVAGLETDQADVTASCRMLPALVVTPPDDTHAVRVEVYRESGSPQSILACAPLQVTPVIVGTGEGALFPF